jgi:hypothetical protein
MAAPEEGVSYGLPPSLRESQFEWPPGSGAVATYREYERAIVRALADKIPAHLAGCPAFDRLEPELRDLEGCPACAAWNEIDWIHGLKVELDATILRESVIPGA